MLDRSCSRTTSAAGCRASRHRRRSGADDRNSDRLHHSTTSSDRLIWPERRRVSGLLRRPVLFQQPADNGPRRQTVIAVVLEDPAQRMRFSTTLGTVSLPLAPPEQGTSTIGTGLRPAEATPASHGLESVAIDRQSSMGADPCMHIHQAMTKLIQLPLLHPRTLRHVQQS